MNDVREKVLRVFNESQEITFCSDNGLRTLKILLNEKVFVNYFSYLINLILNYFLFRIWMNFSNHYNRS
jgi:hypothetical protein